MSIAARAPPLAPAPLGRIPGYPDSLCYVTAVCYAAASRCRTRSSARSTALPTSAAQRVGRGPGAHRQRAESPVREPPEATHARAVSPQAAVPGSTRRSMSLVCPISGAPARWRLRVPHAPTHGAPPRAWHSAHMAHPQRCASSTYNKVIQKIERRGATWPSCPERRGPRALSARSCAWSHHCHAASGPDGCPDTALSRGRSRLSVCQVRPYKPLVSTPACA